MGYTIEYNRQFIRSECGITPVWLCGSNNVYEYHNGRNRRSRDWSVFCRFLGMTEEAMLAEVSTWTSGGEHWMRRGKWISDEGLKEWIHSGCASAVSVEDIIALNRISFISCRISVWGEAKYEGARALCNVRTTKEFDDWIKQAKTEIDASAAKGWHAYPIIDFRKEDLRHPHPATDTQGQGFLVKSKFGYLSEIPDGGNELQYTRDIRSAHVFSFAEAAKTVNTSCGTWEKARIISAKGKDAPYDSVILVTDRSGGNSYYVRRSSKKIWTSYAEENAKVYPRRTDANSALKRLSSVLAKLGWTAQVVKRSNAIS